MSEGFVYSFWVKINCESSAVVLIVASNCPAISFVMSGDAATGKAVFTVMNSKITTNQGDSFYVTNITAKINLENSTIVNGDSMGNFLKI